MRKCMTKNLNGDRQEITQTQTDNLLIIYSLQVITLKLTHLFHQILLNKWVNHDYSKLTHSASQPLHQLLIDNYSHLSSLLRFSLIVSIRFKMDLDKTTKEAKKQKNIFLRNEGVRNKKPNQIIALIHLFFKCFCLFFILAHYLPDYRCFPSNY